MLNNNLSDLIKKVPDSLKQKFILISGSILFIGLIYLMILYNSSLKKQRIEAVESFLSNNQTILLKDYILNNLKSPYLEYEYVVQNNDTIESILKKFSIKEDEVTFVVKKIKEMKLSNIIPGQKISFTLKKTKDRKSIEIVKINYPISKTTFVQIDKKEEIE